MPLRLALISLAGLVFTIGSPLYAQSYYELWQAGAYRSALDSLEQELVETTSISVGFSLDYAELLFLNGKVDTAIDIMASLVNYYPLPSYAVRLAQLYQYRGRRQEYTELLENIGGPALELLENRRLNRVESLALGQLMEMRGTDPQTILRYYARLNEQHPDYPAARVAAGDLSFKHYAYDVAARQYTQALSLEAHHQKALAGLATAYRQSNDPRLQATLDTLLRLNPQHPGALLLQAEQALDLEHTQEALTYLDTVLATNPNHLEALALKAAVFFLEDRTDQAHALRRQVLEFNPYYSAAWRVSGRVASRHYRFTDGLNFQRRALEIDPQDHTARLMLAFDLLRLGQDAEARTQLEQVSAADPYNVQAYNLLNASDAISQFTTRTDDLFTLQLPAPEATVLASDALALLNQAAEQYQTTYQFKLTPPILVQVFADHDQFMVRSVGLPGNVGHLGICFGRVITMDSPRARPPGQLNWHQVLWHEFVHVITLEKTGNRIPRWLSEGISVYEETRRDSSWGQGLDADFLPLVDPLNPSGLDHLQACFTQPTSSDQLLYGYFAGGEFVHFYTETYGHTALVTALDRLATGTKTLAALAQAAGTKIEDLDQGFRAHMGYRLAPLLELENTFKAALDAGQQAADAGQIEDAARAYQQAYEAYPDYRAADAPLRQLAQLYKTHDQHAAYQQTLERIVAWDPKAHQASLELAHLLAAQQQWPEANRYLARAAQVIPFDLALLTAQSSYATAAGDLTGTVEHLQKLLFLDPARETDHRLQLAQTLVQQGDRQAARHQVLTLLEKTPGFWEAQRLLLTLTEEPRQ